MRVPCLFGEELAWNVSWNVRNLLAKLKGFN